MLSELLDRVPLMPFDPLPRIPSAWAHWLLGRLR
jgi:hypothetical protein